MAVGLWLLRQRVIELGLPGDDIGNESEEGKKERKKRRRKEYSCVQKKKRAKRYARLFWAPSVICRMDLSCAKKDSVLGAEQESWVIAFNCIRRTSM